MSTDASTIDHTIDHTIDQPADPSASLFSADDFFVPPADELDGDDEPADDSCKAGGGGNGDVEWTPPVDEKPSSPATACDTAVDTAVDAAADTAGDTAAAAADNHAAATNQPDEINADPRSPSAWQQHVQSFADWQFRHRDAEHNLCVVALQLSAAQERVKSLREALKELTEVLAMVERDEPKWSDKMATALSAPRATPVAMPVAAATTAAADVAVACDPSDSTRDPNTWRSIPIDQLKLKPSIEAKLLESGISTIGQLEDLRADGGAGGQGKNGLRSIKGVGQAKADAIEEAVIQWLTENRDSEVFCGKHYVGPPIGDQSPDGNDETEPAAETTEPAEAVVSTPPPAAAPVEDVTAASPLSTSTPSGIAANDPDAIRAAAIEARITHILSLPGDDSLDPRCADDRYWNGGVEAYDRGVPACDCPIDPPGREQDDWLRGWLTARIDEEERERAVTSEM